VSQLAADGVSASPSALRHLDKELCGGKVKVKRAHVKPSPAAPLTADAMISNSDPITSMYCGRNWVEGVADSYDWFTWHETVDVVWLYYDSCPDFNAAWESPSNGTFVNCDNHGGVGFEVSVESCGWVGPSVAWNVDGSSAEQLVAQCDFTVSFAFDGFPLTTSHHVDVYVSGNTYTDSIG